MKQDGRHTTLENGVNIVGSQLSFTFDNDLVALDGNNLTRILVGEILIPRLHDITSQLAANGILQILLSDLHVLAEVEDLENVLISLITDSTKHRRDGQLLLTIDVSKHHVVDIRRELDPRTLERNDTCAIKHRTIGMLALAEEHTRGTMELGDDHTLGTIDDKRTVGRHIGNRTQEYILDKSAKVLVIGIRTIKFHFGLQGHTIGKSPLQALSDGITRWVYEIIEKLKDEVVARVRDREVFREHLIKSIILTLLGRCVQLQEV